MVAQLPRETPAISEITLALIEDSGYVTIPYCLVMWYSFVFSLCLVTWYRIR